MLISKGGKASMVDAGPVRMTTEIPGLKYDFNLGARVQLPSEEYRVEFTDLDGGEVLPQKSSGLLRWCSKGVYFINCRIQVFKNNEKVWQHDFDASGKNVHIELLCSQAMGDTLAVLPHAEAFRKKYQCKIYVTTLKKYADVLQAVFPEMFFYVVDMEPLQQKLGAEFWSHLPQDIYASYYYDPGYPNEMCQKVDIRGTGMLQCAADMLGVEVAEKFQRPLLSTEQIVNITQPYVCIATHGTSIMKEWNNSNGWVEVVAYLKSIGYRVACIDGTHPNNWGALAMAGCEDWTGFLPLQQRVNALKYAAFFIGIGSGLSWLAWATGKKVILISGFSLPVTEFPTPYRVINTNVCHGCWNLPELNGQPSDMGKCYKFENTPRQWECTVSITGAMVIEIIKRLIKDLEK